jgi:hypothetical protein
MRRPLLLGTTAILLFVAVAAPASAQRDRIRQAFAPAITPVIGAMGFGLRSTEVADGADFEYSNGIALGLQLDRPLTRRTGLLLTLAATPLSRVVRRQDDVIADLGIAGRLKPGAPLFVYVGGGAALATHGATREPSGFVAEPRGTVGLGVDLMRLEHTGVRLLYLAHFTKPASPEDARWSAKSSAFDQTFAIGGRVMLGQRSAP